ncbi:hypothetical protein [Breoghania sp. L-A4]|uniref:hypothetical protein n=1 Tax=Breoghania sp. L-A4 TaxID=2304600 RepID=UPI000E35D343|nr:hypothetical protein [Breoghania sp. L-A4]AXS41418.1 hypothetical protein D1F64_17130 [Breoghania sp. L-A4]
MSVQSLWERQGRVLIPPGDHAWWSGKAQVPTVMIVNERRWRMFFAARSTSNRGHTVSVDIDPEAGMQIIDEHFEPVAPFGEPGAFDCDGLGVTCILNDRDRTLAYYTGLKLAQDGTYRFSVGALEGTGDGFRRVRDEPVLASGPFDPYSVATPHVRLIGGTYHMWYSSTRFWRLDVEPHPEPCYNIKHAVSGDGLHWTASETPAIDFAGDHEGGITRPWVSIGRSGHEMWYCTRGRYDPHKPRQRAYRIGYATSGDGLVWTRRDDAHTFVNPPQPGDWDAEMQCYASVVETPDQSYMFYCGNGYGQTGIGYATRVRLDAP